jgi:peptide/nickel transport system permease protein
MIEVMQRPYIRTAVLKGMSFRRVVVRHALRNAMINPVTVILLQINYLISGVVVVETVFAYPGFGRMILDASLFKDVASSRSAPRRCRRGGPDADRGRSRTRAPDPRIRA